MPTLGMASDDLKYIQLPAGFTIKEYAKVPGARQMAVAKNGVIFVGTRDPGQVYAVIPNATSDKAKTVVSLASHLFMPNGVALWQGDLYVAEVNRILRFKNILNYLNSPPKAEVIRNDLPDKTHHGWKYIGFSPDGWLYVPVGAPCNICLSNDPRFASLLRMKPDGSHLQIYAEGIRNTVGFAWHPQTHELWFTDNGRDWLGDDLPPDKLNHAPHSGMHFGYPFVYGNNIPDPNFSNAAPPNKHFTPPALALPAHVAALGMMFYTGKMFPAQYQNHIFIAEHGSWNRSQKIGYQVIDVELENNAVTKASVFAKGWLQGQSVSGRPVDLEQMPDGSIVLSDDYSGTIYRISYQGR